MNGHSRRENVGERVDERRWRYTVIDGSKAFESRIIGKLLLQLGPLFGVHQSAVSSLELTYCFDACKVSVRFLCHRKT